MISAEDYLSSLRDSRPSGWRASGSPTSPPTRWCARPSTGWRPPTSRFEGQANPMYRVPRTTEELSGRSTCC